MIWNNLLQPIEISLWSAYCTVNPVLYKVKLEDQWWVYSSSLCVLTVWPIYIIWHYHDTNMTTIVSLTKISISIERWIPTGQISPFLNSCCSVSSKIDTLLVQTKLYQSIYVDIWLLIWSRNCHNVMYVHYRNEDTWLIVHIV